VDYNQHRPHSSLAYRTPAEFARVWSASPSTTVVEQTGESVKDFLTARNTGASLTDSPAWNRFSYSSSRTILSGTWRLFAHVDRNTPKLLRTKEGGGNSMNIPHGKHFDGRSASVSSSPADGTSQKPPRFENV